MQFLAKTAAAKAKAKDAALKWLGCGEGEDQSDDISDGDESKEGSCDA